MQTNNINKELQLELKNQGVDFVYFVDISHLPHEQNKRYTTAVLFGKALSAAYLKKVASTPNYVELMKSTQTIKQDEFHLTEINTDQIADHIEGFIVAKGYKAYSQSEANILKTGFYDSENKKTPLPHKTIAGMAGLGWIGKHNLLVTKE